MSHRFERWLESHRWNAKVKLVWGGEGEVCVRFGWNLFNFLDDYAMEMEETIVFLDE